MALDERARERRKDFLREPAERERATERADGFAGTIVHDFKNPLQVIGLAAELACSDYTAPPMRHKAADRIARQVERMTNMLQ